MRLNDNHISRILGSVSLRGLFPKYAILMVVTLVYFFSASSTAHAEHPRSTKLPRKARPKAKKMSDAAKQRSTAIRRFANNWRGVRYKWGGNTRAGIDCSGYAREMFRSVFNVELPRTTRTQIKLGMNVAISGNALGSGFEPGDLFFYVDPAGVPNHVVIYAGNGRFTHSASGRGVVVEGFKALWGRRIVGRRALIPARDKSGDYLPIPTAPAFVATPVPCPPGITAKTSEIHRFMKESLSAAAISALNRAQPREICEWRALANQLKKRGGKRPTTNAKAVENHIAWLESIDSFKDEAF